MNKSPDKQSQIYGTAATGNYPEKASYHNSCTNKLKTEKNRYCCRNLDQSIGTQNLQIWLITLHYSFALAVLLSKEKKS